MHNPLCSGASLKHAQAMGAMITSVARAMDNETKPCSRDSLLAVEKTEEKNQDLNMG